MRKVRFAPALILVLFSLASKGTGADHQHSVGGSIDHVRILVRDISDSREAYEKLGFEFWRCEAFDSARGFLTLRNVVKGTHIFRASRRR